MTIQNGESIYYLKVTRKIRMARITCFRENMKRPLDMPVNRDRNMKNLRLIKTMACISKKI